MRFLLIIMFLVCCRSPEPVKEVITTENIFKKFKVLSGCPKVQVYDFDPKRKPDMVDLTQIRNGIRGCKSRTGHKCLIALYRYPNLHYRSMCGPEPKKRSN